MKASVVIAAMNAQDTIGRALRSVLGQSLADCEILVVDDASVDATRSVVRGFMAEDARVILLENAVNRGVSAARNRGLDAARGDWVAVLDADDAFAPTRLAHLIARAEAAGHDMIGDNLYLVESATGTEVGPAFAAADFERCGRVTPEFMLARDGPDAPVKPNFGYMKPVIARAFLERHGLRYQEDVWCAEDFLLYFDCLLAGAAFGLTPEALYRLYTNNMASLSRRTSVDREVSRVNRLMIRRARASGRTDLIPRLAHRQRLLDTFAFFNALHHGRHFEALRCAPGVPAPLLLRKAFNRLRKAVRVERAAQSVEAGASEGDLPMTGLARAATDAILRWRGPGS